MKKILVALILVVLGSLACPKPQVYREDPNPAARQNSDQEFRNLNQQ